jgi:hypothetical protein
VGLLVLVALNLRDLNRPTQVSILFPRSDGTDTTVEQSDKTDVLSKMQLQIDEKKSEHTELLSNKTDVPKKPLTVRLRVLRFSHEGDDNRLVGEVGKDTYRTRFDDRVEVEAELSEPAYAYLIAFNPTDKPGESEQVIPRSETNRPQEKRDHLATTGFLRLNDGVGLQVFAVVASRQPLPSYTEWRKQCPPLEWGLKRATRGVVRQCDGVKPVHSVFDDGPVRAEEEENDKTVIDKLARALRGLPGIEAVAVIGFAVQKLE